MDSLIAPHSLSVFELLVRVTILLSAAPALAWLARKRPARVRHLLWTLTFALLLALPGLSLLGPSWEVPIIPSIGSASPAAPPEAPPVDGAANGFITLPAPVPALPDAGSTPVPVQESVPPTRSIPLPLLLWGVGCAAVLASLVMGGVRFAELGRAATPLDDPIRLRQVEAVRQRLGIRGDVRVVLSRRAATPMTGGLRRPVVLLPMSATLWTPERWTVVLTHEMIHLCRRDVLRQLMVRAGLVAGDGPALTLAVGEENRGHPEAKSTSPEHPGYRSHGNGDRQCGGVGRRGPSGPDRSVGPSFADPALRFGRASSYGRVRTRCLVAWDGPERGTRRAVGRTNAPVHQPSDG